MARMKLDEGQRFDYRVGNQGYTIGGFMQDTDPGTNPMGRPRMVLNGRFLGGGIVSRPPYSFVDGIADFELTYGTPPDEPVTTEHQWSGKFISEHHPTRFNNQIWVGKWDGNSSYLMIADQPFKQPETIASYPSLVQKPPIVERFNNQIFVGDTGYLRRMYRVGLALADLPTDDILYTFDGYRVYAMHEYNGRLFVFVADPAGVSNSYVFSYDGQAAYSEKTFSTNGKDGASFVEFNGKLFLGIKGSTSLEYRNAAGTWSTISDGDLTYSGFANQMIANTAQITIFGDDRVSSYSEPAGTPTLTAGVAGTGLPSGWTSATVGCRIGSYVFWGGSKIWPGDSVDTPVFLDAGGDNPTKINAQGASSIITKGMAVAFNRVYFCYGFRSTAAGGSAVGFFVTPRTVQSPIGANLVSGGVGTGSSIEFMKGDH